MAESKFKTVDDAADYLNVTVSFVRTLIFEKRIPYIKLGRQVRLDQADLDAFIEAGRRGVAS